MTPRHQVSRAAIELIKRFEGYRRKAAQLSDGRWTIGYGHTLTAREGAEVSEADAEALLLYDLIGVAHVVDELTYADVTQNQFDALCAFAFGIGVEAFRGCDVLKRLNEGAFTQAAFAMELWRKAEFEGEPIVIDALVRRRAAEKLLFLTPPNGAWRAVPAAVLKPLLDEAAPDTAPRGVPVQVVASLEGEAVAVVREPPQPVEPESPVRAAAEAVTARLQALFAEPPETPPVAAPEAEAAVELELEPEPDAEPLVPAALDEPPEPALSPDEPIETEAAAAPEPEPETEPQRVVIDDTSPFEFVPPPVQSIEVRGGDSVLAIVSLIVLGLAFFAGGLFWALNAPSEPRPGVILTPMLVGWLAGVAGVGFVAVAVFMLLQRVTRAAERR